MKFYKNLYYSESIHNIRKIRKRLKAGKLTLGISLIICNKEEARLEIVDSLFLKQWYFKEHEIYVVGIAKNTQDAYMLIEKMALESFQKTGKVDLYNYLFIHDTKSNKF